MTKHVAINAILAIGMLMVILTGGIDLSVGSIVGLAGIVAGVLLEGLTIGFIGLTLYPPVWVVVLLVLAVGAGSARSTAPWSPASGSRRSSPRSASLYIARGAALLISNGETYPNLGGIARARQHGLRLHRQRRDPRPSRSRSG